MRTPKFGLGQVPPKSRDENLTGETWLDGLESDVQGAAEGAYLCVVPRHEAVRHDVVRQRHEEALAADAQHGVGPGRRGWEGEGTKI